MVEYPKTTITIKPIIDNILNQINILVNFKIKGLLLLVHKPDNKSYFSTIPMLIMVVRKCLNFPTLNKEVIIMFIREVNMGKTIQAMLKVDKTAR